MATNERPSCSGQVWESRIGYTRCANRATVERNGKRWCKVHDPEAERARKATRDHAHELNAALVEAKVALAEARRAAVAKLLALDERSAVGLPSGVYNARRAVIDAEAREREAREALAREGVKVSAYAHDVRSW